MRRNWTPECHVTITDAVMVIEIELGGVLRSSLMVTFEGGHLCIRGQHKKFGPFECKFEISANYNPGGIKATFPRGGHLRFEVPVRKSFSVTAPRAMLIYCNGCGKHFDIVVAAKGPENYRCPTCGKVQVFDLEAFVNKALEQGKKMLRKRRGGRGI